MIVSDELDVLPLRDGGTIAAEVSYAAGLVVTRRDPQGAEIGKLVRAYPAAGWGGGGWLLSPSGRLLVLGYYSGQSEEAFLLLDLSGGDLRLVAATEYRSGECGSYAFSPEEDTLVLILPRSSTWWETWEDDWLEAAEDDTPVVPFASLIVCTTSTGHLTDVEVELAPNAEASVDPDIYDPDLHPRLSSGRVLTVRLPWGDATVDLSAAPARVRITQP